MKEWLLEVLACPRHLCRLEQREGVLACAAGCTYPIVQGIPVLLLHEVDQTFWVASASLEKAHQISAELSTQTDPCIETLGISSEERSLLAAAVRSNTEGVDPVVSYLVGATNGILYKSLIGRLPSYPIPDLRLPVGKGTLLLDIGCNWGRWCVAAARLGYRPIGIDPSLGAVLAANRICRELEVDAQFVVGDARNLPFNGQTFDVALSYSVLQHFSKKNVQTALCETSRVLKTGGRSMIQMANSRGIRSLYHQARRRFRAARGFDVRYWTPTELKRTYEQFLGPTVLSVDCFFGLGIQEADEEFLSFRHKLVVRASRVARSLSEKVPFFQNFADSLYACSIKKPVPLS